MMIISMGFFSLWTEMWPLNADNRVPNGFVCYFVKI